MMLSPTDHARRRIQLCYLWRFGRLPDLAEPRRFTALVQLRKLAPVDPRMPPRLDKLAVKDIVASELGRGWVVPTVWSGPSLPAVNPFGVPAIIKARHGCNQNRLLRVMPSAREWRRLQVATGRWMMAPYGGWLDEGAYRPVPRGILAERMLGDGGPLPTDYKIYVFGGVATHVQVHLDREHAHHWYLCDRAGVSLVPGTEPLPLPRSLDAMLAAAERLASGMTFARVDFYEVAGQPLFGEFSFYPGSGLDRFAEDWIDFALGRLWLDAQAAAADDTAKRWAS